jgi:hypothetical protein
MKYEIYRTIEGDYYILKDTYDIFIVMGRADNKKYFPIINKYIKILNELHCEIR